MDAKTLAPRSRMTLQLKGCLECWTMRFGIAPDLSPVWGPLLLSGPIEVHKVQPMRSQGIFLGFEAVSSYKVAFPGFRG